jgi:hypothetical protein
MRTRFSLVAGFLAAAAILFAGCSHDVTTDSLSVTYQSVKVLAEKVQGKAVVTAEMTIRLVNRTEHGMNIVFVDGTIIDAKTNAALLTFRPIIPDSYGSISTASLLPKQTKDYVVVTPPDLDPFDITGVSSVIMKLAIQTTDKYRTEIVSVPVAITVK